MAGTIVVDRIESDASYTSTINVANRITFSNTVNFGVFAGTAPVAGFYLPTTNNLAFTTASTERMRIDSSGNVGIGTASPGARLQVVSTASSSVYGAIIYNQSATGQGLTVRGGSTSSQDTFNCQTYDGGLALFTVLGNGNVVIPTGTLKTVSTISVGNATPSTSGAGITFPATQSASTDVNTLDDYEEGTWTPALLLATGSITFSTVSGGYVKIGKLVYIRANFSGTATISSPTGDLRLSGLPFTAGQVGAGSTTSYNMAAGAYSINFETLAGTTTAYIFNFANGTRSSAHSYILAGSNLTISACYEV